MRPELVAHRGYALRYPENTLSAFEAAIAAGARFVECDVQLSADGFPVLMHDRTLERLCGLKAAVHELPMAELHGLSCGEPLRFGSTFRGERIATLAGFVELLHRHPHVHAFVEIKRVAIAQFGSQSILERVIPTLEPAIQQCALISFSLEFLAAARGAHAMPLGAVFDRWEEKEQPHVRALAPEFVFCDLEGLPPAGSLEHEDARIAIYEVADAPLARALYDRGVHMVETFAVAEMIAQLR